MGIAAHQAFSFRHPDNVFVRRDWVCHRERRGNFGIAFGRFKQSGAGREGIHPRVEAKTIILDDEPAAIGNNTTRSEEGVSS
jgi:hypothetical protein